MFGCPLPTAGQPTPPLTPQVLDFGLNHVNSAVVLATARLFLRYTLAFPEQHRQVGVGGVGGRQAGVPARVWGQVYLGVYAVKRESAAKRAPAAGLDPRIADPVPASNLKRAPQTVPAPCLAPGTPCLQPCCPCLPACLQPPLRCPWLLQVVEVMRDPLRTLLAGREPEVAFAVLSNLLVLARRYPELFAQARKKERKAALPDVMCCLLCGVGIC